MMSRGLVERRFLASGIAYRATPVGRHVVGEFESGYATTLRERAAWAVSEFGKTSERQLTERLRAQVDAWEQKVNFESMVARKNE
jgi:hypothetical protein